MTERIDQSKWHDSQRGYFSGALHNEMVADPKIIVVSADLGYGQFDAIRRDFPERFINVGAAELSAIGIGVGLSLRGYKPFVYTISSFYMRAAEPIALYLAHEQIPVKLIGGGRDQDYAHDGISHDARFAQEYMHQLGIRECYPDTKERAAEIVHEVANLNEPCFVSLQR